MIFLPIVQTGKQEWPAIGPGPPIFSSVFHQQMQFQPLEIQGRVPCSKPHALEDISQIQLLKHMWVPLSLETWCSVPSICALITDSI